jgi:hypothetical protein
MMDQGGLDGITGARCLSHYLKALGLECSSCADARGDLIIADQNGELFGKRHDRFQASRVGLCHS